MCLLGTFAEHIVVSEHSLRQDRRRPPARHGRRWSAAACRPAGARRSTRASVRPGDTVVVVGIGGVGINAVQGAALAGAQHVIAVDPVEFKREQADGVRRHPRRGRRGRPRRLVTELTRGAAPTRRHHGGRGDRARSSRRRSPASARAARSCVTGVAAPGKTTIQLPVRADAVREADPGRAVRQLQPVARHPAAARAVPGGPAQARRADHHAGTASTTSTRATATCTTAATSAAS